MCCAEHGRFGWLGAAVVASRVHDFHLGAAAREHTSCLIDCRFRYVVWTTLAGPGCCKQGLFPWRYAPTTWYEIQTDCCWAKASVTALGALFISVKVDETKSAEVAAVVLMLVFVAGEALSMAIERINWLAGLQVLRWGWGLYRGWWCWRYLCRWCWQCRYCCCCCDGPL